MYKSLRPSTTEGRPKFRLNPFCICPKWAGSLAVLSLLNFALLASAAQDVQPVDKGKTAAGAGTPEVVAKTRYMVGPRSGELILLRTEIAPLSSFELLDYLRKNPQQNSFPNLAFVLVDSPTGDATKQELLWIVYAFQRPLENLTGNVVWDSMKKEAYVGVLRSNSAKVVLSIYRINPQQKIGSCPVELNPKKYQEWPKETSPLTQFEASSAKIGFCGLKSIELSVEQEHLRVLAARSDDSCRPVTFSLNLKTLQWSEVEPAEGIR